MAEEVEEKIQQKTVVAQVMMRIKELIASGRFKVNDKIPTESELSEMFGVGRSSVREAVKIFQYLGVLEARVPKGTFVCDRAKISEEAITWSILLGQNSLSEIIELRRVIEQEGVNRIVQDLEADPDAAREVLARLHANVEQMRACAALGSRSELAQLDYEFHAALIDATGNSLFAAIYRTLHNFMQEEILRTYKAIRDLSEITADHEEIVDFLRSADSDRALKRHNDHFSRIRRLLTEASDKA
ncbi:MAG TPA: FCD domain-containing protein [Spirochaetia bacterium]|nr:FCD domain-containing protein [Spirochaetia bacterium]